MLWRVSPLFWLVATSLVTLHNFDADWRKHVHALGAVVLSSALGLAGSNAGAIEASSDADVARLVHQLADATAPPRRSRVVLRRIR